MYCQSKCCFEIFYDQARLRFFDRCALMDSARFTLALLSGQVDRFYAYGCDATAEIKWRGRKIENLSLLTMNGKIRFSEMKDLNRRRFDNQRPER